MHSRTVDVYFFWGTSQTILESLSRVRLCDAGLPEPRLQVPIYDEDGLIGYVDMLWEDLGVVGEADGALKYGDERLSTRRRFARIGSEARASGSFAGAGMTWITGWIAWPRRSGKPHLDQHERIVDVTTAG